jgi:uncharacterized membrane protein HdeD (DUF308 family)
MLGQIVSLAGAAMVLYAYAAHQMGRLQKENPLYLCLNLVGAGILTFFAVGARQAGLALMEGAWVVISLVAILSLGRRGRRRAS